MTYRSLWVLVLCGCGAQPPTGESAEALSGVGTIAVEAGTDGVITTLAYYSDGTPHPGLNAIDVGAPGGSSVYHQLDYLPSWVAGGWVYVEEAHESGLCSQWYAGSRYYNGAKVYVTTYLYDTDGNYLGKQRAAFQHVDPYAPNMNSWWTWNNAQSDAPRYDWANITYGDGTSGGLYLGGVHAVYGAIYNGPGGGLCTTGSHLHQESEGWRAGQRRVGERVTGRYSDLHYF